jgi:anti-sigma regulatory factor (Ser/Thr protein kinase)
MTAFVHEALLYRHPASYLDATLPFVRGAVADGSPVLVAVPRTGGELLRRELGWCADRVRFLDMAVDGRNPARIIPAVLHAFITEHAGRHPHIVSELMWPGRSATEYPACVATEALTNAVFTGTEAAVLCPYDARALEPEVLADAALTHPVLVTSGGRDNSHRYADPEIVVAAFNRPLPPAPMETQVLIFDGVDDLVAVRDFAGKRAADAGLAADRVVDLQVAANELATNTIRHAGGPGAARIWVDGGSVVCEISDGGHIRDPLVGRIPPPISSERGRGLLLVNYLCDLTRMYTVPGVTAVRMYLRLS